MLGLAAPPPPPSGVMSLDELVAQALEDRKARAETEEITLRSADRSKPWTDYAVTSGLSCNTYRVALRSEIRGDSYCSCLDFRINSLGICKHIFRTLAFVRRAFNKQTRAKPHRRKRLTIGLRYHQQVTLWVSVPHTMAPPMLKPSLKKQVQLFADRACSINEVMALVQDMQHVDQSWFMTPDAEDFVERAMTTRRLAKLVRNIRKAPATHALRTSLLRMPLLPYQLDGIAFAGLGKTIQGVGVAGLLHQQLDISRVLIIFPA
jgi:hypothetical protein